MTGSFFAELRRRNVFRVAVLYGIVAWLILQVSDIAMPALRLPEWTLSFVLYLLAIGFPIALIVAWAFELTPEGLKRTREVDPDESITPVTGQKINHLIIAVLAVAVAYLLLDKFLISGTADREIPVAGEIAPAASGVALTSIAVLPFVNMSADPEQEYFADGISEELLNLLAKIEDFKVAGRTSSFAFKGKNEDLRVIADKLGVSTVLEGSVRKDGDQIRVTAQLVKADDGYHLWSETYDRKLDSIFAIQDEIASEVVSALKHTLLGEEDKAVIASAPRTQNTEAYTSYLRGKHILRVRNEENLYKALREFRHSTEVDPDFAPAWAGVANTYTLLANYQFRPDTEVLPLAESAVDKSLSLDPNLGEAWAAKGLIFRQQRGTSEQAIAPLEKAVQLSPSDAEALMWLSGAYAETGQYDKAMASLREAYEIDPLFPVLLSNLAIQAGNAGDAEGAARYLSELASVAPDDLTTFRAEAFVASNFGHWDDSFKAMRKAYEAGMGDLFLLGLLADRSLDYGDPVQAAE